MHGALRSKLQSALTSRENRQIRRTLPSPSLHTSPSSSSSTKSTIDFTSNDYLSLSLSPHLRQTFLSSLTSSPDGILGSGGSRLLINTPAHTRLETRLKTFFKSNQALLFNSGFDANVGFFSVVPQEGDAVVYDEYIHASVHDGMRASRVNEEMRLSFAHNSLCSLREALTRLRKRREFREGRSSVFVSVESLYSMDGTFAPLLEITEMMEQVFPLGNAYLVVDEAHSTGIYGPEGRGRVALLGLENKVLARLVTFGKALAATGGMFIHFYCCT
jgi:8-amino-7-oxononanoate synthase